MPIWLRSSAFLRGAEQDKINSIMKPHAPYFGERECALIELANQL